MLALHLSGLTNREVAEALQISKTRVDHLFVGIRKVVEEDIQSPLSEQQRQLLAQYVAELPPGQIAERLGLTVDAVRHGLNTIQGIAEAIRERVRAAGLEAERADARDGHDRVRAN
jgi:DNA-directed RNA polymerase specialized sigma24 family protein